jgi:pimeloyl-ACP methyl ester carboxylesterase
MTTFGPSLGVNHWGNDDFLAAFDDALDFAESIYGLSTTQVAILGLSMGGMALNWVWRNPTRVRACALVIPAVALEAIHDADPIGLAEFIELAYTDLAGLEAAYATHDPSHPDNVEALAPLADRIRIWYSTDDNVIDAADVEAFASATGIAATQIGAVGHNIGGAGDDVVAWLAPLVTGASQAHLVVAGDLIVAGDITVGG